jgi:hypothetical protein
MFETEQPTCSNCGNSDVSLFEYRPESDASICQCCGVVLTNIGWLELTNAVVTPQTAETADNKVGDVPPTKHAYKGSYDRRAYIVERLRAACLRDPQVPPEDQQLIQQEYIRQAQTNWIERQRADKKYITKRDIQNVLRSLDKQYKLKTGKKGTYATRYLEKWKSIKAFLGAPVKVYTPEQVAKVGARLMRFSSQWNLYQPAAHAKDRDVWIFKNRKDFPSINFMIRRIHQDLKLKGMDADFPIPQTTSSKKQLQELAEFLNPSSRPKFKQTTLPFLKQPVILDNAGGITTESEELPYFPDFIELVPVEE